jgi:hypothetical protein
LSYNTIARAALDGDLQQRLTAAAAQEGHPNPQAFVQTHLWQIVSEPGIADAYAYALGNRVDRPGHYDDVVNDATILTVVQPLVLADLAETAAPA